MVNKSYKKVGVDPQKRGGGGGGGGVAGGGYGAEAFDTI